MCAYFDAIEQLLKLNYKGSAGPHKINVFVALAGCALQLMYGSPGGDHSSSDVVRAAAEARL